MGHVNEGNNIKVTKTSYVCRQHKSLRPVFANHAPASREVIHQSKHILYDHHHLQICRWCATIDPTVYTTETRLLYVHT